ncbi:hypothetical protein DICVIV_04688 [Dictyocaulus viviparus]|uniref:Uncharacterized protein n=1 Tax=Dictyocaulus viviparus TaxID=29172 RepID=A0A0D8XZB1_DICVI|nr:hypothetical protein DICVIV_04688 [Dictyocaulus viviparus]
MEVAVSFLIGRMLNSDNRDNASINYAKRDVNESEIGSTVVPEAKREQIRSNATSQSRPLPLPLFVDSSTPLITQSSSKEYMKDKPIEEESVLSSPTRIAQVFPMISKNHASYIQRSVQDVSQNKSFLSVSDETCRAHSFDLHESNPSTDIRRSSFDVQRGTGRQLPSTEGLEVFFILYVLAVDFMIRNVFVRKKASTIFQQKKPHCSQSDKSF